MYRDYKLDIERLRRREYPTLKGQFNKPPLSYMHQPLFKPGLLNAGQM
jgi:hypothetical protein